MYEEQMLEKVVGWMNERKNTSHQLTQLVGNKKATKDDARERLET